jgi:hypothetical protein
VARALDPKEPGLLSISDEAAFTVTGSAANPEAMLPKSTATSYSSPRAGEPFVTLHFHSLHIHPNAFTAALNTGCDWSWCDSVALEVSHDGVAWTVAGQQAPIYPAAKPPVNFVTVACQPGHCGTHLRVRSVGPKPGVGCWGAFKIDVFGTATAG